jgi:hypothetical protein
MEDRSKSEDVGSATAILSWFSEAVLKVYRKGVEIEFSGCRDCKANGMGLTV